MLTFFAKLRNVFKEPHDHAWRFETSLGFLPAHLGQPEADAARGVY